MKKLIIALIAIAGLFTADTAQAEGDRYVTIASQGNNTPITLNIAANQVAHIVLISVEGIGVQATIGGKTFGLSPSDGASSTLTPLLPRGTTSNGPLIVAGPCSLIVNSNNGGTGGLVTVKISPNLAE